MSTTTHALPGPESLAGRILTFFKRNPLEEYTRTELTQTFDVTAGAVTRALEPLMAAEWVAERTDGAGNRLIIAGPKLAEVDLTPGAATARVLSTALAPKTKTRRQRLAPLDLSKIVVKTGQLVQPRLGGRGAKNETIYAELFEKLDAPETWCEVDAAYAQTINKALVRWRKQYPGRVLRLVKVSDSMFHLQRLADKPEGATC